jgi:hypothetical protein
MINLFLDQNTPAMRADLETLAHAKDYLNKARQLFEEKFYFSGLAFLEEFRKHKGMLQTSFLQAYIENTYWLAKKESDLDFREN